MSVFNLENQNANLDNKIVAGLERLSQVFRILLWEKAKEHSLSPIQIQLLIFIRHHSADKTTISYLAQEFNFTKPTISDAIKILEQKKLVSQDQVRECKNRMNTFGFTGTLESQPDINCIYQNDSAKNLFINQPGSIAPATDNQNF